MRRTGCLLCLALLAGCGRNGSGGREVRLAVGGQAQLVYLPATLAAQLGYYCEAGLNVAIQDFPGGAKSLEALLGGSVDVVSGFYDHTIQMAAEGRRLEAFASMLRYPGFVLAVSPAAQKKIERIEDLKGTVVGVTAPGSSSHFFLNYLLAKYGLGPDDVSTTGVGSAATAVAAVEHGKVDAAILFDPAVSQLEKRDPRMKLLVDARTAQGIQEVFGTATYPAAVLYSTAAWVERNPDTARRLAQAIRRTLAWIQTHSAEEIMARMPESFRLNDTAVYLEALRHSRDMFSPDGVIPPEGAAAVKQVLQLSLPKVRAAGVDLAKTYTNQFVAGK